MPDICLYNNFKTSSTYNNPQQPILTDLDFTIYDKNYFKKNIPNIPKMDEHSLSILIKNNVDIISNDILKNDTDYAPLLQDYKFISAFIIAIKSIPDSYITQLACNKITYDYFTSENPSSDIKQRYLDLSRYVNRDAIRGLISIGLDEPSACNLALCRYSSSKETTNVKRLNFAICNRDPEVMTEQKVVWIYEKLFSRISDLFQATMLEYYSYGQQIEFGDNFMEIYGTVSLAVLTLLNNMPSESIRKVLLNYHSAWADIDKPPVRFSLRALSGDYSRITRVVEHMINSGVDIP